MDTTSAVFQQVLLIIFDGWGYRKETKYNAIAQANPVFFNNLWANYPHALLKASGEAIGLPEGQIGTSEIAHTTIGAGKVMYTDIVRVNKMIADGTFCENENLQALFAHVKKNNSTLHLIGQVSPGGVHSHQEHLFALLRCAKKAGITNIAIHVFTDGRDEPPMSEEIYLKQLNEVLQETGVGRVASMIGRYFAMDRDTNWDRTQVAVDMLFAGKGEQYTDKTPIDVINQFHKDGVEDQYIKASVFPENGKPQVISQNDGIFFFNFRPDRAIQLSRKIEEKVPTMNLFFETLSQYEKTLQAHVFLSKITNDITLAEEVAKAGLTQAHIAETEKFAHVTYFFDGERDKPYEREVFELIPSQKVATHDLAPEMRAKEIADKVIEHINKGTNFIVVNFANADMVGHVGKFEPTVKAIQVLDVELKRVIEALQQKKGIGCITADHGNAELMFDEATGQPKTAHTLNPVPFILTEQGVTVHDGSLEDVAPTVLQLLGLTKPEEMTGKSLIDQKGE